MPRQRSVNAMCRNRNGCAPKHRNDAFSDKTITPDCAIARGGKSGNFLGLATLPRGAVAVMKDASPP
jgi:hypothetical protein